MIDGITKAFYIEMLKKQKEQLAELKKCNLDINEKIDCKFSIAILQAEICCAEECNGNKR